MKAQFAVVEVLVSVMLLSAAAAVVANSSYNTSQLQSGLHANYGDAIYDFSLLIAHNETASGCILGASQQCKKKILESIARTYGLEYARFDYGGSSISNGSYAACSKSMQLCFPVSKARGYTIACIYVCGA